MSEGSYKEMYYQILDHCGLLAKKMQKLEALVCTQAGIIKGQKHHLTELQSVFEKAKSEEVQSVQ